MDYLNLKSEFMQTKQNIQVVMRLILFMTVLFISLNLKAHVDPVRKIDKRINILFLMSDQHRGDYMGVAGANWVKTPNLDQLASEGVLFAKAYCSLPSCLPARASILTGMSPWQHGLISYNNIPDFPVKGPALFSSAGYRTHAVGKNHFNPMREKNGYQSVELEEGWYSVWKDHEKCDYTIWFERNAHGKDLNGSGLGYNDQRGGVAYPYEEYLHPTHWTAEKAIEFLKTYKGDSAWLLKVTFQRPHTPLDPPKRWIEQYAGQEITLPGVGDWAETKYGNNKGTLAENNAATYGVFPADEIRETRRSYAAAISYVDEQLGSVIAALKERGEFENTLILYTSDHGDMMGDQHLWRKCRPYEGSVRIPMIIRWPENLEIEGKRGQIRKELVELRDIFPTFLDAAGIPKPSVMDGMSMLNILKGEKWREILDLEHAQIYEPDNAWVALTDGKYKYIWFTLTGQQQLFDLEFDPCELINIGDSENYKELVNIWRKRMVQHLSERGDDWVKNSELVIQKTPVYYGINHPMYKKR
jgi:arylsulfatase A-like enzyme